MSEAEVSYKFREFIYDRNCSRIARWKLRGRRRQGGAKKLDFKARLSRLGSNIKQEIEMLPVGLSHLRAGRPSDDDGDPDASLHSAFSEPDVTLTLADAM